MSIRFREFLARGRRVPTAGPATPSPRVDRVLDSLRAPASPRELAREDDALASFHRARLASPVAGSSEPGSRARRTGLKAALASAAAVALLSTGAAFAASGHAPWSHTPAPATAATTDHTLPTHPTRTAESEPTDEPSEGAGNGPDAHAMWGLCRAYLAGAKAGHGQALSSPAFVALALAAGGTDQVADFCTTLPRPGSDRVHPTRPALPSHPVSPTRPTQAASPSHPAPTSHPTAPPTHPDPTSHPDSSSHPAAPESRPSAHSHP